jgi:hypothetical protein
MFKKYNFWMGTWELKEDIIQNHQHLEKSRLNLKNVRKKKKKKKRERIKKGSWDNVNTNLDSSIIKKGFSVHLANTFKVKCIKA